MKYWSPQSLNLCSSISSELERWLPKSHSTFSWEMKQTVVRCIGVCKWCCAHKLWAGERTTTKKVHTYNHWNNSYYYGITSYQFVIYSLCLCLGCVLSLVYAICYMKLCCLSNVDSASLSLAVVCFSVTAHCCKTPSDKLINFISLNIIHTQLLSAATNY